MPEFTSLISNSAKPHNVKFDALNFFAKDAFALPTLLLIGAVLQSILFAVLPYRVALAPPAMFAIYTLLTTAKRSALPPTAFPAAGDDYISDVVPGRSTAQLPDPTSGRFGYEPAARPVLVFHFGVRFNHPLGMMAPGASEIGKHFEACNKDVETRREEFGMLGMTTWRGAEQPTQNTLMNVYYFRDVEGLNRFAHDKVHTEAWKWLANCGLKHFGFFHEAFAVPAHAYETIYANIQPTLMGATTVRCADEKNGGAETWVQPLVSADAAPLRTQMSRMGRASRENNAMSEKQ